MMDGFFWKPSERVAAPDENTVRHKLTGFVAGALLTPGSDAASLPDRGFVSSGEII